MNNYIEFNKNYKDFIHINTKRENHQLPRCILKVPKVKEEIKNVSKKNTKKLK